MESAKPPEQRQDSSLLCFWWIIYAYIYDAGRHREVPVEMMDESIALYEDLWIKIGRAVIYLRGISA